MKVPANPDRKIPKLNLNGSKLSYERKKRWFLSENCRLKLPFQPAHILVSLDVVLPAATNPPSASLTSDLYVAELCLNGGSDSG